MNQVRAQDGTLPRVGAERRIADPLAGEQFAACPADAILDAMADGVIAADEHGRIHRLNASAQQLLGQSARAVIGQPLVNVLRLVHEETRQPIPDLLAPCLHGGTPRQLDKLDTAVVLIRADGCEVQVGGSITPLWDRAGRAAGAVLVLRDVSAQRHLVRMVSYQATHDMLTGVANRREFERRLGLLIEHNRGSARTHALLYLDLDQFKSINDSAGHDAGDEVLRQVTGALRSRLRERDTLARLGGDEFGVILGECSASEATHIADTLRALVQDLRIPWKGRCFAVTLSIGVATIDDGDSSAARHLEAADRACYAAKRGGRNRVHLFERERQFLQAPGTDPAWLLGAEFARLWV